METATVETAQDLKGAFTRYLRTIAETEEPTPEAFGEVWRALGAALAHELRRRSLWTSPPSYLGVFGRESWQDDEALEELLVDAYAAIFVRRLARLQVQLERHGDVEGLVFRCLRNFVHDRQKDHDPLGYRIFEVVHDAVAATVDAGELVAVGPGRRIRNDTVLATAPEAADERAGADVLRPIVARWNDDLLPDLVTAGGAGRPRVVARLCRHLLDLEAEGLRAFRFGDLLTPLKDDVRNRWSALFDFGEGESVHDEAAEDLAGADVVRVFHPETRAEEMEDFKKLVACVSEILGRAEPGERSRRYLLTLWEFLRRYASDEGPERLPSNRKLAELLRIPRRLFPELYETVARAVTTCREKLSATVVDFEARRTAAGGRTP